MVLLAVACLVVGATTTLALRRFLVAQVDQQLVAAGHRSASQAGRPPPQDPSRPAPAGLEFLLGPGQQIGTVGARVVDGQVTVAGVLEADGTVRAIPADQRAPFAGVAADDRPHDGDLRDLGGYRLIAEPVRTGGTVVTGLPLSAVDATVWWLVAFESAVAVAVLVAAALAGTGIVRLALRPLRRVAATAGRVAELPLDRGEVALSERVPDADTDPRTEVGQVGAALNRMLDHVGTALAARHASETRVRHFVADASHELRTPLAAIRGYAELTRRGRDQVPEDIAYALSRVESESARMTTLVDDLLLLARLDAGRDLATGQVDLSRLVVDAVNDARIAAPGHVWALDLPPESIVVTGDGARLHQVLANLLSNARTHTPPGTRVTTTLTRGNPPDRATHGTPGPDTPPVLGPTPPPGRAAGPTPASTANGITLTVVDDGPGIPEGLEVFERFARGDSSRSRAAGSTGLGLAIVAAVVAAHQGTVEVTSAPGRTAFTVRLPSQPAHSPTTSPA
ncbi:HAMP domain-containing sensor histidine kinase [Longispora sp. NPDC051575]|uniref:sensor histidine kinase n=1 Tax=Longispora sp. NPDC051575 TaxID=3154943 RepID=UPI0034312F54